MNEHMDKPTDQDVLARIDPEMDAMLDNALSADSIPGGVPSDLADRIVDQTRDQIARLGRTGVIARIGRSPLRYVAAAIILIAELGVVGVASSIGNEVRDVFAVREELTSIARYEPPVDSIDAEIELLSEQLDLVLAGRQWDTSLSNLDVSLRELDLELATFGTGVSF